MAPAWSSLAAHYEGSSSILIADVDCTGAGEPLCSRFNVEGFPTILYFNPPDQEGEMYEGGRDEESLLDFAKKELGMGCAIGQEQHCSDEEKLELQELAAIPEEERKAELEGLQEDLRAKEEAHEKLLSQLQEQYEASNQELEDLKKLLKPRIKQLKRASYRPVESQVKTEL